MPSTKLGPPNQEIQDMLKVPGIYYVSQVGSPFYFAAEVEPDGTCYQLTPALKRDGILSPDGWHPNAIVVQIK